MVCGDLPTPLQNSCGLTTISHTRLFILEGAISAAVAICTFFILPDWPHSTKWLTDDEKRLAAARIKADAVAAAGKAELGHLQSFKAAWRDWRCWVSVGSCLGHTCFAYSLQELDQMFTFMYAMIGESTMDPISGAEKLKALAIAHSRSWYHHLLCKGFSPSTIRGVVAHNAVQIPTITVSLGYEGHKAQFMCVSRARVPLQSD
jgi:hypothetical protein